MSFLEPKVLILALAALVFWVGPWRARRPLHAGLRTLVWLALVVALAHPLWRSTQATPERVLVIDRSASMTQAGIDAGHAALNSADADRSGEHWSFVEFGAPAGDPLESGRAVQMPSLGAAASNLADALALGASALPAQAPVGLTLVSDGLGTTEFPVRALSELRARGVPLTWIRPPALEGDVRPVALEVANEGQGSVRIGMPCSMVAIVEGQGQMVRVSLSEVGGSGDLAMSEDVVLDGATRVPLAFEPQSAGFLSLELRVEVVAGRDGRPGNERLVRPLAVQDPLRVAYLGGRMQAGAERLAELVGPGFEITEAGDASSSDPEFRQADLVVLDDRPSEGLTQAQQDRLVEAVMQEGLGLLAAGGEAAFGPGGYHDQPIEQLLPVEMVQKEEKRDPSTSLVLIIDTSGSMGGNRVQLAKQVSRLAIRRLLPHDKVGIVEFYGAKRWAVPLQPASNSIEIERALNRLDAGGGTVILPAIEEAYYGLKNVRTRYKHVLILTDGGVETGAFEPLLRRMSDDGINVSTVLVGPDAHSEFLVNIANWGQGRFYSVPNRFNLPEILLKQPASAKLPAYRPGIASVAVHGGRGWWGEVDASGVPSIAGYVETRLRPGAERLIETASERHPILSSWRYGLGRVSALTTEPTGPGTETWRDWSDYGALLSRVLLRTANDGAEPFAFALHREGAQVTLVAERRAAASGEPWAEPVDRPGQPLTFAAMSPDRFEARWRVAPDQEVRLLAGALDSPRSRLRLALPAVHAQGRELQVPTQAADRLQTTIEAMGGQVLSAWPATGASMPLSVPASPVHSRRLAPWFALLALIFYLLDLLYRRLPSTPS